jgi:hypothetical protein
MPMAANSADKPGEAWPTAVQASYRLRYNGLDVGRIEIKSNITANTYSLSGSGKVSVLFGAMKWWGSSSVSGSIESGAPSPAGFSFDWHQNKKSWTNHVEYKNRVATDISLKPVPRVRSDTVPLTPAHKSGAVDPMSAILMLTKADGRPPCDRRVAVFDGKARYDIVFTPKRMTRLPAPSGGGSEMAHVCRITYEPIAGHRDNADTKAYVANRDVEVVLRRIPGSQMLIPYSVTIPSAWGTGTMVSERMDIVTETAGKIAFTN